MGRTITYKTKKHCIQMLFWLAIVVWLVSSCASGSQFTFKSNSAGKADEILWVMNEKFWQDTIGETIHHKFLQSYDVLPQVETNYFLRKKNFQQFNNDIIKRYRTIVICISKKDDPQFPDITDLVEASDVDYKKSIILHDVWAAPQTVIIVIANNEEQLATKLAKNIDEIEKEIRIIEDRKIDASLYGGDLNMEADKLIRKRFGFKMDIPEDYFVGIKKQDFLWIRKETYTLSSNILVYKRKLKSDEIKDGVDWEKFAIQVRNYLGKSYISTNVEGSYMTVEQKYAPVLTEKVDILGKDGLESKGLWKMKNAFMGGPYINLSWFDEKSLTYYMVDGYVHAPKEGKKQYMRDLNWIFDTISIQEGK